LAFLLVGFGIHMTQTVGLALATDLVPPESQIAVAMRNGIAEARSKGNLPGALPAQAQAPQAAAQPVPAVAGAGGKVSGSVTLAPALNGQVSPEDTLFVFARAAEGPRMPLAILRKQVKDLPVQFVLDDSMAMTPTMKLSAFPKVVVGARISKSGNATPQKGDLQGLSAPLAVGAEKIAIVIDAPVN
jgi:cytochrome c-type biogenesis protein CcmH